MIRRMLKLDYWKTRRLMDDPNVIVIPKSFANQQKIVAGFKVFVVHETFTDSWLRLPEDWQVTDVFTGPTGDGQIRGHDHVVAILDNNEDVRITVNLNAQAVQVVPAFSCSLTYDGGQRRFIATLYIKGAPELVFPYGEVLNVVSIHGGFENLIYTPFMQSKAQSIQDELNQILVDLGVPDDNHVHSWNTVDQLAPKVIEHFKMLTAK